MAKTNYLGPQRIIRAVDTETNKNLGTWGAEDMDQSDHLRVTGNGPLREIRVAGRNDGETGDAIPALGTFIPNVFHDHAFFDDFADFNTGAKWTLTNATAGTGAVDAARNGVLLLDSASSTADQGVQIQQTGATFALAASKQLVFAARFKVTDLANNSQIYVGLGNVDTTFMAAGVVSATDYIGFFQDVNVIAGTGDYTASTLAFGLYDGVTLEENKASVAVMTEDTYLIAGFVVDGVTTATPFIINDTTGARTNGTAITITDPPDAAMAVTLVCQSEGTVDPIMSVDWVYCHQTR